MSDASHYAAAKYAAARILVSALAAAIDSLTVSVLSSVVNEALSSAQGQAQTLARMLRDTVEEVDASLSPHCDDAIHERAVGHCRELLAGLSADKLKSLLVEEIGPEAIQRLLAQRPPDDLRERQRTAQYLGTVLRHWQSHVGVDDGVIQALRRAAQDHEARLNALTQMGVDLRAGFAAYPVFDAPSKLFRPENRALDLIGRTRELDELRAWCEGPQAFGVACLSARGGTGKTRLALELITRQREERGWWCGTITDTSWFASFAHNPQRIHPALLLVLDYAD